MPRKQRWQGTQKSKGKLYPEGGNPKTFRTVKEKYEAWSRTSKEKYAKEVVEAGHP